MERSKRLILGAVLFSIAGLLVGPSELDAVRDTETGGTPCYCFMENPCRPMCDTEDDFSWCSWEDDRDYDCGYEPFTWPCGGENLHCISLRIAQGTPCPDE